MDLKKHLKATGDVSAPDDSSGACIDDIEVTIQKKKKNKPGWKTVDTKRTNQNGHYSVSIPDKPGKYRAKIKEETRGLDGLTCEADKSDPESHKHNN